ncbi:hypothetical protein [Faecalibaculum rodentium]|uniref:hypothetical protein n=1 Tax=Faecalibaculum rodentium TaxID=1702221 RepID=UPI002670B9AA|nr:hypothetical protein [Faecalibaculum rodentium]
MKTFEVGKKYYICDFSGIAGFEVIKRTPKTVTVKSENWNKITRHRIVSIFNDQESIKIAGTLLKAECDEEYRDFILTQREEQEREAAAYRYAGERQQMEQMQRMMDSGMSSDDTIAVLNRMRDNLSIFG